MSASHFARLNLVALLALWFYSALAHAQPRFEPLLLSSNRVKLALLGDAGGSYAIEGSPDLVNWAGVFSGIADNDRLEFETEVQNAGRMFFRGRSDEEAVGGGTLDVVPALWTNYTTRVFVMQDAFSTTLFASNRTEFTLSFPSNTVADALLASMTVVTKIANFPFSGPVLGAVQINLDDDQLLGAAELSIKLMTNVDRRRVVSFTASQDGSDFTLSPDRVNGNVIRIPVDHSGIYGSCLATPEEVAAVLQTINSAPTAAGARVKSVRQRKILQTSRLCFPDDVSRALAVRSRIRRQMRPLSAQIGAQLNADRQSQLAGDTEDSSTTLSRAASLSCDFYNKNIAPRWTEAAHNCSLMNVLLQFALGIDRQLQLLGVPDAERCTANVLSPQLLCPGFKDCLQEIKACCSGGHPGKDRIRDIVSLTRQQQILGISGEKNLGCFDLSDPAVKEVIDICIPRKWSGNLHVSEKGSTFVREEFRNGFETKTKKFDFEFSGFITEASEQNFGSQGFSAHLVFEGIVVARGFSDDYGEADNGCQIIVSEDKSEGAVYDLSSYSMDISSLPQSGSYVFSLVFGRSDEPFELPMGDEFYEQVSTRVPPGIGCPPGIREMASHSAKEVFEGPLIPSYLGTAAPSASVFQGKYTGTGFGGGLTTEVEVTWQLERKKTQ